MNVPGESMLSSAREKEMGDAGGSALELDVRLLAAKGSRAAVIIDNVASVFGFEQDTRLPRLFDGVAEHREDHRACNRGQREGRHTSAAFFFWSGVIPWSPLMNENTRLSPAKAISAAVNALEGGMPIAMSLVNSAFRAAW